MISHRCSHAWGSPPPEVAAPAREAAAPLAAPIASHDAPPASGNGAFTSRGDAITSGGEANTSVHEAITSMGEVIIFGGEAITPPAAPHAPPGKARTSEREVRAFTSEVRASMRNALVPRREACGFGRAWSASRREAIAFSGEGAPSSARGRACRRNLAGSPCNPLRLQGQRRVVVRQARALTPQPEQRGGWRCRRKGGPAPFLWQSDAGWPRSCPACLRSPGAWLGTPSRTSGCRVTNASTIQSNDRRHNYPVIEVTRNDFDRMRHEPPARRSTAGLGRLANAGV